MSVSAVTLTGTFQCQSLMLGAASGPNGLQVIFTTPSTNPALNPQSPFNGEFPFTPGARTPYQSYWVMYQGGVPVDMGLVGLSGAALTTDSDGDGVPDIADRSRSANTAVNILAVSDLTGGSEAGSITLARSAGQTTGSATVRFNSGPVFNSKWTVPMMDASGSYDPAQRTFRLRTSSSFFAPGTMTGIYRVNSSESLTLDGILMRFDNGTAVTLPPTLFTRHGKEYWAVVTYVDGDPIDTSYPDLQRWTLRLVDSNDSDGDGIPNLSDATPNGAPPVITGNPASTSRDLGQSVTFSVAASGAGPLSYQWFHNGAVISGAIMSSYSIQTVGPADAGTYSVRVHGLGGEVVSSLATLTINTPASFHLGIKRELNGRLTFTWTDVARLTTSQSPSGPFIPVARASSGYQVLPGSGTAFYRLEP